MVMVEKSLVGGVVVSLEWVEAGIFGCLSWWYGVVVVGNG